MGISNETGIKTNIQPLVAVEKLTQAGFSEEQAKLATSILLRLIAHESYLRRQPTVEPTIQVEIKRFVSKVLKNGFEKKAWGVEIRVNDDVFPVIFGGKDQTMVYICTLLRRKLGESMFIHEFYNNSKGRNSKFSRPRSRAWLKAVFNAIFPSMDRSFEEWIETVESKKGRPLNQGKAQASSLIQRILDSQPEGISYCVLDTKVDEAGDSYYYIGIKPENIIVPQELSYLVDEFYEMTGANPTLGNNNRFME